MEREREKQRARARAAERRIKRFQLITKTPDPAIGRVYLSLAELDAEVGREDGSGGGDVLFDSADLADGGNLTMMNTRKKGRPYGGGDREDSGIGNEKNEKYTIKQPKEPLSKEERALEAFFEDEEWESTCGPSRMSHNVGRGHSRTGLLVTGMGTSTRGTKEETASSSWTSWIKSGLGVGVGANENVKAG